MRGMYTESQLSAVRTGHEQMLIALRQREQDIIRFLVILGPSLGSYVYLVSEYKNIGNEAFIAGVVGVEIVLMLGIWYTVVLGYSYRSIEYQLSKFEVQLGIESSILLKWQKYIRIEDEKKYDPPEILKVFGVGFFFAFLLVGISACHFLQWSWCFAIGIPFIVVIVLTSLLSQHFGEKFKKMLDREEECNLWKNAKAKSRK